MLTDGGIVSGARTAALTLTNVTGGYAGGYAVLLSNSWGSVTSRTATLTVRDPFILSGPRSQVVNVGGTASFTVSAAGAVPLNYQWRRSGSNLVGASMSSLALTNVQTWDAGHYDVVVSTAFGASTSSTAALIVNQVLADTFNPGADSQVRSIALQRDGKVLVAGWFQTLAGEPRFELGRLNSTGSLDAGFNPGIGPSSGGFGVYSLALQPDEKILVGGWFDSLAGQPRTNLARLQPDGRLDAGFNAHAVAEVPAQGYGFSAANAALQTDGKILIWGYLSRLAGQPRTNLGRLHPDGTLDTLFKPAMQGNEFNLVLCAAIQPDGKTLVSGAFTSLAGQGRTNLGRLNADGTLDAAFNPPVSGVIYAMALQADGRILVGGSFSSIAGQPRTSLARLNLDGSLDLSFNPVVNGSIYCLALQADGRIVVGGNLDPQGTSQAPNLARFNPDGSLDTTFAPMVANNYPMVAALQTDGRIVVGGSFTNLAGQTRTHLGRLVNNTQASQSLTFDGAVATWMRGGSSPEVWRTGFDFSTNGTAWWPIGAGARITGGWRVSAAGVPASALVRAQGFVAAGDGNASSWVVEATVQGSTPTVPPTILTRDPQFGVTAGQFGFTVSGGNHPVVLVEGSTNLLHWLPLATNYPGLSEFYFSDPAWVNFPQRFYRVRTE